MLRFVVLTITVPAKEDPHKLTAATAVAVRPRPDTTGKGTTKTTAMITETGKGLTKSSVPINDSATRTGHCQQSETV